jgi:alpha-galactosidase
MYFNTWQAFRCNLNEDLLRRTGEALVATGLAAAGFSRLNMDDCEWRTLRLPNSSVVPDETRFPSGMSALVERLRALNLTLGVYTSATSTTCVGRPGSYMMEAVDAATWCSWGMRTIKVDNCGGKKYAASNASWIAFRAALAACPNDVLLSVESCSDAHCASWIGSTGVQMFRTTADMQLYWQSVVANLDGNEPMAPLAGPGLWPDPDMLVVGHPGFSPAETRSHLAAWAVIAAPLGLSFDLVQGQQDEGLLALLTNPRVLGVNQDAAGIAGVRATAANATGGECWAKPLSAGGGQTSAVLLFNRGGAVADVTCQWGDVLPHLPSGARARVVDLWEGTDLGVFAAGFTAKALESHASMLVTVTPV